MKRSGKQLSSKTNFSPILNLNCSNIRLKLCEKPLSIKIVREIKFEEMWSKLEAKKMFLETIIHKIFDTNSSFYVKQSLTGKV